MWLNEGEGDTVVKLTQIYFYELVGEIKYLWSYGGPEKIVVFHSKMLFCVFDKFCKGGESSLVEYESSLPELMSE